MTDLSSLVADLECASAPSVDLWLRALRVCRKSLPFTTIDRFMALLDAKAWLDAALLLMPEDRTLHLCFALHTNHFRPEVRAFKHLAPDMSEDIDAEGATIALAVALTAIRAIHA